MLRFSGAGGSDVGLVRAHNEDSGFISCYLALVADGVGGAAAGEVASATAAFVLASEVLEGGGRAADDLIRAGLSAAADALHAEARSNPGRSGMATTVTLLATDGAGIVMAHLGDSRCYGYRRGELTRLSVDHTFVQQLIDSGDLPADAARDHPLRHVLVRSLSAGGPAHSDPDIHAVPAEPGDRFLLCTDGLTDLVSEQRIATVLAITDAHSAASRLIEDALAAGGLDNITCVVLDVVYGPEVVRDGSFLGAAQEIGNVIVARRAGVE